MLADYDILFESLNLQEALIFHLMNFKSANLYLLHNSRQFLILQCVAKLKQ